MSKSLVKWLLLLALGLLLVGCSTKAHVAGQIKDSMKKEWAIPPKKPNKDTQSFSYYLPSPYKILSTSESNVIFQDQSGHPYILFVNSNEGPKSKVNYNNDVTSLKKGDAKQSLTDSTSFSYVIIRKIKKDQYELILDRGGVKLSTKTPLSDLPKLVKPMEVIVHSVKKH